MVVVPGLVANDVAFAESNTKKIQAALDTGGYIFAGVPGEVYINNTLIIGSKTSLFMGKNTRLKLAPNTNKSMLKNANWGSVVQVVTSLTTPDAGLNGVCVVSAPHGLVVGDYALILGATQEGYNDIWKVTGVSTTTLPNDTFTFNIAAHVPNEPLVTPATGTITVCKADYDIEISGAFDYNGANQTTPDTYERHAVYIRRVHNYRLLKSQGYGAMKYAFMHANMYSSVFDDIFFDTFSDGIHMDCSGKRNTISRIRGKTGDDLVAILQGDYPQYKDAGYLLGYIDDLTVSDVKIGGGFSGINLLPANVSGAGMGTVRLRDFSGRMSGGASIVKCLSDTTAVATFNGVIQSVEIDGITSTIGANQPMVGVTCNVRSLSISNIVANLGNVSGSSTAVNVSGTYGQCGSLRINNVQVTGGAASSLVYIAGVIGLTPGTQYDAAIVINNVTGKNFGTGVILTSTASFNGICAINDYYVDTAGFVFDVAKAGWTLHLNGYSHIAYTTQAINIRSTANSGIRICASNLGNEARSGNFLLLASAVASSVSVFGWDIGVDVNNAAIARTAGSFAFNRAAAAGTLVQNNLVACDATATTGSWKQLTNPANSY